MRKTWFFKGQSIEKYYYDLPKNGGYLCKSHHKQGEMWVLM